MNSRKNSFSHVISKTQATKNKIEKIKQSQTEDFDSEEIDNEIEERRQLIVNVTSKKMHQIHNYHEDLNPLLKKKEELKANRNVFKKSNLNEIPYARLQEESDDENDFKSPSKKKLSFCCFFSCGRQNDEEMEEKSAFIKKGRRLNSNNS